MSMWYKNMRDGKIRICSARLIVMTTDNSYPLSSPHTSKVTRVSHQGLQLRVINEVELGDEEVVVLVACIDVGLCTHAADTVKVVDVNMHKHPEETAQDLFAHLLEVLRERNTCRRKEKVGKTVCLGGKQKSYQSMKLKIQLL